MKPINKALMEFLLMLADVGVYIASVAIFIFGLALLITEGKQTEALAIGGAALVIFCKIDQAVVKLNELRKEGSSQYVRKNL